MLEAVKKWLPVYATGAIEPFYYPRLRDGLFQRTMFIAPKTAAILSSSVRQETSSNVNLYLTRKDDLAALTSEYVNLLQVCKPLMRIYGSRQAEAFFQSAAQLFAVKEDAIYYSRMPPLFAMPEQLALALSRSSRISGLFELWRESLDKFEASADTCKTTVLLLEPKLTVGNTELVQLPLCEMHGLDATQYTPSMYAQHIDNLLRMERRYNTLTVIFKDDIAENALLYSKEYAGTLITTTGSPNCAFSINEQNMAAAFWTYLSDKIQ